MYGNNRLKVVIWGASDGIWNNLQSNINPLAVSIVAFIDKNLDKQGLTFHGLPIISLEKCDFSEIDYILIAAYSGMQTIKQKLKEVGIPEQKIVPYLSEGLINYYVGDISDMCWEKSLELYFEPEILRKVTKEYIELSRNYDQIEGFSSDANQWYCDNHLISHACGGYVNGRPLMYTNSREALEYTFESDFQLMECDVVQMPNGEWYLAHRKSDLSRASEENYTPLSLKELVHALSHNTQISCLFDIKWKDYDEYESFVDALNHLVVESPDENLKSRLILEVYDEETIIISNKHGYQMFFTQYRNDQGECLMKTAILCEKYGIRVVGMGIGLVRMVKNRINVLKNKGIVIYVFSTDYVDEYTELREMGVYGVFTNFLR